MDPIEKIIRENCWRFDKGYPSTEEDFSYLKTIIESTIKEQEEEEISKDDIKKLIDSTELSPIQLKKLNSIIGKITFTAPIEQYLAQKAKESNISRGQIVKFQ